MKITFDYEHFQFNIIASDVELGHITHDIDAVLNTSLFSSHCAMYRAAFESLYFDLKYAIYRRIKNIRMPSDLPDELRDILEKMLAFAPEERYQNCSELVRVLEYYIYRDGYGPTMVTLSEYMKDFMPGRFGGSSGGSSYPPEYFESRQISTEL